MTVATQPFTGTFVSDQVHSSLQFALTHMQVGNFRASFGSFDALAVSDDHGLRIEGKVRTDSVSITDPPEFREHVVNGADFFDATNHPEIAFRSVDAALAEDGTFAGTGELTMRGITRPVAATGTYRLPVEDPYGSRRTAIELTATVDRRDWGMDWQMALPNGGDALGYDVVLTAHIELVEQR
ncbi:MAG: YceI family protein [Acidimicrobiales bacterium]